MEDAENPLEAWIGRPGDSAIEWTRLTDLHPQSAAIPCRVELIAYPRESPTGSQSELTCGRWPRW